PRQGRLVQYQARDHVGVKHRGMERRNTSRAMAHQVKRPKSQSYLQAAQVIGDVREIPSSGWGPCAARLVDGDAEVGREGVEQGPAPRDADAAGQQYNVGPPARLAVAKSPSVYLDARHDDTLLSHSTSHRHRARIFQTT